MDASGGNPSFALGLGRALKLSDGRLGEDGELPVSRRLDELLRARIDAMAPKTWEMFTLAALLADPRVLLLERAGDDDAECALMAARLAAIVALERARPAHPPASGRDPHVLRMMPRMLELEGGVAIDG